MTGQCIQTDFADLKCIFSRDLIACFLLLKVVFFCRIKNEQKISAVFMHKRNVVKFPIYLSLSVVFTKKEQLLQNFVKVFMNDFFLCTNFDSKVTDTNSPFPV